MFRVEGEASISKSLGLVENVETRDESVGLVCLMAGSMTAEEFLGTILSIPSVWLKFGPDEWDEVLSVERSDVLPLRNGELLPRGFGDVVFTLKYTKLDALSRMKQLGVDSDVVNFISSELSKMHTFTLQLSRSDLEDLDGRFYVSYAHLREFADRLAVGGYERRPPPPKRVK